MSDIEKLNTFEMGDWDSDDSEPSSEAYRTTTTFEGKTTLVTHTDEQWEQAEKAQTDFDKAFSPDSGVNVVKQENVVCQTNEEKQNQNKRKSKARELIIGIKKWVVEVMSIGENASSSVSADDEDQPETEGEGQIALAETKKVRSYNKTAEMPKITYSAPIKGKSFAFKLTVFLIACAAVGVFMGVQANSYFFYKGGKVESTLACAWSWLMEENMPITFSPINGSVFGLAFLVGFGILGIIGLFIWLDGDAKKQSRVGHEHGNARLGTKRDFKIFKRKFMD